MRRLTPFLLLAILTLVTSGTAWLGIRQAQPHSEQRTPWTSIVTQTKSAGAMAFTSTVIGGGLTERTRGLVDFQARDEIATTVSRTRHLTQRLDLIVINGVGYQRIIGTRFDSDWVRLTGVQAIVPFAPLVGSAAPGPELPSVRLLRLVKPPGSPRGMTEYQVRNDTISCLYPHAGQPRFDHLVWQAWVDRNGRIRRFVDTSVELFPPSVPFNPNKVNFSQTTSLSSFGQTINVQPPKSVSLSGPASPEHQRNPFAGCRVDRGNGG